jgi:hypothetical protein
MNQDISIGTKVIATDFYWGTYTGTVVESFNTQVGNRVKVKIERMIEAPRQYAIFFQENLYPREPYCVGEVVNFFESEIEMM